MIRTIASTPHRNIELKARCADLHAAKGRAIAFGAVEHELLDQLDTYFGVPGGRLKLRQFTGRPAELIFYHREDSAAPRPSEYQIARIDDAEGLLALLTSALGQRGQVRKHREVLLWQNVRIHLDHVEHLGDFVEFEAVICSADEEAASYARLDQLAAQLQIVPPDVVKVSYADLLEI